MKITRKFVLENRTERKGWTKKQLEQLGVNWPPVKGWLARSIGKEITEAQAESFATLSKNNQPNKKK